MPSFPSGVWARVQVFYGAEGFSALNSYYFQGGLETPVDQSTADALGEAWLTKYLQQFRTFLSDDVTVFSIQTYASNGGNLFLSADGIGTPGLVTGDVMPGQDAAVISWGYTVAPAERRSRGRTFLSGLNEDDVENGLVGATILTEIEEYAALHLTPLTVQGDEWIPAIHRLTSNQLAPIISYNVDPVLKTIRNRRPGS